MKNKKEAYALKNTSIIILLIVGLMSSLQAQNKSEFWSHVGIGGAVGLSFGSDFFSTTIAPSAIYQFNSQFALGLGLNYTYSESKDFYRSSVIGGSVIGFYNPIREVQISAEFEQLNVNRNYFNSSIYADEDYWYPALFLGAGYNTGPVTVGIRFDVLYNKNRSIYANPWAPFIRVYF